MKGNDMTYTIPKNAGLATIAALTITATLPTASAMAKEATTEKFVVQKTTDGRIKLGVKAFKKGYFEKTVRVTRSALNAALSPKKAAIAHSNLCAAYAKLEMLDKAQQACAAALELRPGYEAAQTNKASLTIRLAQK